MATLVINSGSSSVKFALFDTQTEACLASGIVERLGSKKVSGELIVPGENDRRIELGKGAPAADAMHAIVASLRSSPALRGMNITALGHRVVHGGERFTGPELVTDEGEFDQYMYLSTVPADSDSIKVQGRSEKILINSYPTAVFGRYTSEKTFTFHFRLIRDPLPLVCQ